MFRRSKLLDADRMFLRFFDRWYDDEARQLKGFKATRPDLLQVPEWAGKDARELCPLTEDAAADAIKRVESMWNAAADDWPKFLSVLKPIDLTWIAACDEHFNYRRVEELARNADPSDYSNDYFVTVCEFGAVLGLVMMRMVPRLAWLPSWPYWESAIFDRESGNIIPVFHWAIKKFSTYGIDDGFAAKVQGCLKLLTEGEPNAGE